MITEYYFFKILSWFERRHVHDDFFMEASEESLKYDVNDAVLSLAINMVRNDIQSEIYA
jgi:hypothetical protein